MGMAKICKNCACYEVCFMANPCRTEDCNINWQPIIVLCKDCKHGIWDEDEQMWECILGVDLTGDPDTYAMFHEYNDGEHFCSYGERKDNGR